MAVANSGNGVLVDTGGITLAGFTNAAASNIKLVDNKYDITSNAIGGSVNGSLNLQKASGAVATLSGTHTITVTGAKVDGGAGTDSPIANMSLDVRGVKLVFTGGSGDAEALAPMVGDSQTQIIYRASGTTWNSVHPGTNLVGSTLVFESTGDGHLGKNPSATVRNVTLLWRSTSPAAFVLAINAAWANSKPIPLDGYRFVSVRGNNLVSVFAWTQVSVPGGFPNNAFHVCRDWTYDVAAVGAQPTALLRSYRRAPFTAGASSQWGAVSVNATHLHIDLKTSLSAAGVLDSGATYLRSVNYNAFGSAAGNTGDDILSLRFAPTLQNPVGAKLANASIVVTNTNAATSYDNSIGTLNAKIAASGVTDATGRIVITEPSTKDYTSNASHRTDSIVVRNRTLTTAWHKWWEAGTKLIPICDTRSTTGAVLVTGYAASDFAVSYRHAGSVFTSSALVMDVPQTPTITLSIDSSYNATASTTGITVTYSAGITTVAPAAGTYTLDQIYKSIVDFHATADANESNTVLPVDQGTGTLSFGSALVLTLDSTITLTAGTACKSLITTGTLNVNGATITAPYQDANNAGQISIVGVLNAETVEFRKASDNALIASRTGPGSFAIAPANVGIQAYFMRLSGSNTVMSTITSPVTLASGVNPDVPLYAGAEVQVAQAARIEQLPTLAQIEASTLTANIAQINGVTIQGAGVTGDGFRPV